MPECASPITPAGHAGARLLVVDDDPQIGAALVQLLRRHGYGADFARNGRIALAYLSHHQVDIVLSDIFMPDFDGLELLRALRRVSPRPRLVAMTGQDNPNLSDMLRVALQLGAERAIRKPFDPDQLLRLLGEMIGFGRPEPEHNLL